MGRISSINCLLENMRDIIIQSSKLHQHNGDIEASKLLQSQANLIDVIISELNNSVGKNVIQGIMINLSNKLTMPNDSRFETDDTLYYEKLKAQIRLCKQLLDYKED